MLGTKIYKNNMTNYATAASWCNTNGATIEDKGEYYEVVEVVEYKPSVEEQISQLDAQYEQDKKTLQGYYVDFMVAGDTEGMESVKAELDALTEQYDSDLEVLKGDDTDGTKN